jgi:pyruvate,orthophosphate dikinase
MARFVFAFEEGSASQKDLLGGKGANLAEMTRLGFPVPPGFTITTETCNATLQNGGDFPDGLLEEVDEAIAALEKKTGKVFGDSQNPLLVSVRSGAKISMPGMMDTVLNLGMNDAAEKGLGEKTGNPRFAADSHRRFVQMFSDVVLGVKHHLFEEAIHAKKAEKGVSEDTGLAAEDLHDLAQQFKQLAEKETGNPFPDNAREQLKAAIGAVFASWDTTRAKKYREIHNIPDNLGTAVNVQVMVFGNTGKTSGTGVVFTRNPSIGEKQFFGDFLMNAQGEDVVAGIRTPREIAELETEMPSVYAELFDLQKKLEEHFCDMQDIEFTIEDEKLYLLQTRSGKRTAAAAIRIAVEMVEEGLITKEEALLRIDPKSLDVLLHPSLDPDAEKEVITTGIAASPGAASGKVVFSADDAVEWTEKTNEKVILVRHETSPEDIHGMHVSTGVVTACGGKASHAAVVARGMGKPCVSGAADIIVNEKAKKFIANDTTIHEGDVITIDGATGEVMLGDVPTIPTQLSQQFQTVLSWADELKSLRVRANADTPGDAENARRFGAEGIGLCRTEHMFFSDERIHHVRQMILARNEKERIEALNNLLPYQRSDFEKIFTAMDGLPVTIRLLDPPLHEFLPKKKREISELATGLGLSNEEVRDQVKHLTEVNPMLGHRGCRLLITYPEILRMQTQAILEAAVNVLEKGVRVLPEIMIPLVGISDELKFCRKIIEERAEEVFAEKGKRVEYQIGTMIELPRACAAAERIADYADFFSFGTNDLTQMTFGFSRDDVGQFLPVYLERGLLSVDPFETVDAGVQELIKIGVERGRRNKKDLKISVCGEHGGDPTSIRFFHGQEFSLVSCSPFRVPIARLAAAQVALKKA